MQEAQRLSLQTLPRSSDLGSHSMGSANNPSFRTKGMREGHLKSQGYSWSPSRSVRRLRGSSCTQNESKPPKLALGDSEKCDKKGAEPITVQGFEGWTPEGFDSRPRTTESGTAMGGPVHGQGPSKRSPGMP